MKVKVRRFDKELPLPEYKTSGAAAMDCAARETAEIKPGETVMVPLNIAIDLPDGYFLLMAARSSLYKRGLVLRNGIGIGDCDYCGDGDEYRAALYNFSDEAVTVERGDRVTQILILSYDQVGWEEVDHLGNEDRGGFGSTGIKN